MESFLKIKWRVLVVGILVQYMLGVFVLRTEIGFRMFRFMGDKVDQFLDYIDNGCRLVFGPNFKDHYFAFKVMPVIIFFSVNLLYYLRIAQYVLAKVYIY